MINVIWALLFKLLTAYFRLAMLKLMNKINFLLSAFIFFNLNSVYAAASDKVRIGWQKPWATQGQLVVILKTTDILKKNKLKNVEFIGANSGPELNELAIAKEIDVILTADQPAAMLFSKSDEWLGIGRLMYNRTSTYVPVNSDIKTMKDLKKKTIGVPIGAAAERILVGGLSEAGLNPKEDVKILNLAMTEQSPLIQKSLNEKTWGDFDALSGFDPIPAVLETQNKVRAIHSGKVVALVLLNKKILTGDQALAGHIMQSIQDAYAYYKKNTKTVDELYAKEVNSNFTSEALKLAASIEPNVTTDKISTKFSEEDFRLLQEAADFATMKSEKKVNMRDYVSNQHVK